MIGSHTGNIKLSEGTIIMKDGNLVGGSFVLNMNSITVSDIKEEDASSSAAHYNRLYEQSVSHTNPTFDERRL